MKAVSASELHVVWARIRPDVEKLLRASGEPLIPEDVYCAIRNGHASLFTLPTGWCVLVKQPDIGGGSTLLIWLLHVAPGTLDHDGTVSTLREMARAAGCWRLRNISHRKGWKRRGWKLTHYVYEIEV